MGYVLTATEAQRIVASYLPVAHTTLVHRAEQALQSAEDYGYPVVMKAIAAQLVHKTDVGAVKIVKTKDELLATYRSFQRLAKRHHIRLDGVMIQEFVHGKEIILGIKKDPTFGYALMLGFGGIYAEVFKDVTFRLCPITELDAESMIEDLKSKKILYGTRGEKPVNLRLLKQIMVKLSRLPERYKITELDINPFIINHLTGKCVDARIVLGEPARVKKRTISQHKKSHRTRKRRAPKKRSRLNILSSLLGLEET